MKLGVRNSNRGYKIDRWLTMIEAQSMIEIVINNLGTEKLSRN